MRQSLAGATLPTDWILTCHGGAPAPFWRGKRLLSPGNAIFSLLRGENGRQRAGFWVSGRLAGARALACIYLFGPLLLTGALRARAKAPILWIVMAGAMSRGVDRHRQVSTCASRGTFRQTVQIRIRTLTPRSLPCGFLVPGPGC